MREQMKAYLQSVKERGIELSPDQKAMIAEFEADDELLDQSGRVDFYKGAEILTPEEFSAVNAQPGPSIPPPASYAPPEPPQPEPQQPKPPLPMQAPMPAFAAGVPADAVDVATARLWMMQQTERDAALQLLARRPVGNVLSDNETRELRRLLSSLVVTLTS